MLRYALPLAATFLLLATACPRPCSTRPSYPAVEVGQIAPHFEAASLDGQTLRFPEDVADKVVLVRFWAEKCPVCESTMKELETLYQQHMDKGFVILAVNSGQPHSKVEALAQRATLSYTVLVDEQSRAAKQYGVMGLPTSFMVDKLGVVRARFVGQTSMAEFEQSLLATLASPAKPPHSP
ncbi:MAG: TlpA family protein disulfide reductase [Proteobacteria bacterium]|nr:TlpA family protein disulfide reductase [Cystobacterineae bacterium]MCL2258985.1 TlpA family protein disulfide reductase [Cystobacterineae bacterium]MCL2313713.1 TlpA family protein disulfide reductase [Pseudomonadota bacterium]